MSEGKTHIPFRASKMTLALRDSFISKKKNKVIMIACICPGSNSSDHSMNTLRYADRLKNKKLNQNSKYNYPKDPEFLKVDQKEKSKLPF